MASIEEQVDSELRRVIGATGYEMRVTDGSDGQLLVRIDAAEAVWAMCPDDLIGLLQSMPNRAGPLALRQAVDQHPSKVTCD
jgi:hypothetical protein